MAIDKADIRKLARLTRLNLTEQEEAEMQESLNSVLGLIDELQQADVEGIDDIFYVQVRGQTLRCRQPNPQAGIGRESLLQNAPDKDEAYFLVPKVVE